MQGESCLSRAVCSEHRYRLYGGDICLCWTLLLTALSDPGHVQLCQRQVWHGQPAVCAQCSVTKQVVYAQQAEGAV